jgi:hypothetical protein
LAWFFSDHLQKPFPSPALIRQITQRFLRQIDEFADRNHIPVVRFRSGERKDDVAKRYFARFHKPEGVVFIGVAQEWDKVFRASPAHRKGPSPFPGFNFFRTRAPVNQYYFYVQDRDWGPGFIKFSSYAPWGAKVCLNGHEWAKQQLRRRHIRFEALDNGFLSCTDPVRLQRVCDHLGPQDVDRYFRRWLARLPHPFTAKDRAAGYRYELYIWQCEYSHTQVFDRPLSGRQFFDEVLRENLDLGRPDRIQILFGHRVDKRTPSTFRTRVVQHGTIPKLSVEYKHSWLKQYLKEGRALRTEMVVNNPWDVFVRRSLHNLPYLRKVARSINRRLLKLERTSHDCTISHQTFESFVLPSNLDGQHVPGLRFGDPRVTALLRACCRFGFAPDGFTNSSLRPHVAALHDPGPRGYTASRMTYDLRRLRQKGIIERVPGTHRYMLTPQGRRTTLFLTKTYLRIVRPGLGRVAVSATPDPTDTLAHAFTCLDAEIDRFIAEAKMSAA